MFSTFAAAFVLLAIPGPTNLLLMDNQRRRGALGSVAIVVLAYTVSVSVLTVAFAPLTTAWPQLSWWIRIGVAVWLAMLAFDAVSRKSAAVPDDDRRELATLFVTTLVNPKALVLAFGILNKSRETLANLLQLPALWIAAAAAASVWLFLGRCVQRGKARVALNRLTSAALAGFAVYLGASY